MYPKLYNANETNFNNNGLGMLTGAISAVAIEELNGMSELHIEYDSEGFLASEIHEEMIIKAKANDKQEEQLFRIYSITKNHENDNLIIDAQHITYDLANNFVEQLVARDMSKRQVMEAIGNSASYSHPFELTSPNTSTVSSTSLYRTNPLQMVAGMQGSVLQIWGGQIERDNYRLIMHDRRGSNDGVLVTYKKNLTGLNAKFDISNVVTRIFPFAYDEETDTLITVPGKYIDSPHINDYEMPFILPIDFSHEMDIETSQDLLDASQNWFEETGRDKPRVEMEVEFEHLWETEEYKDVVILELVGMGDTVTINHSKLDIEATAIVNRIEYDVIARKNIAVDLGNVKASFTDKVNRVDSIVDRVDQAEQNANQAIRAANGKNTIHYGPDEPTGNHIEDDLWFRVIDGEYTRTYRFDGIQWQLIMSKDVADIEHVANDAHNRADEAHANANKATQDATDAINQAQTAFDEAQNALLESSTARSIADTANDIASDAYNRATTAGNSASQALQDAGQALSNFEGLRSEFDNLEIGGRNLISDSHFDGGSSNGWSSVYGTNAVTDSIYIKTFTSLSASARIERNFDGLESGEYTLTIYADLPLDINWRNFVGATLLGYSDTSAETGTFKIYTVTFRVYDNDRVTVRGYLASTPIGSQVRMDWFQLEKGNRATDWSPAPEDIFSEIDKKADGSTVYTISEIDGMIDNTVSIDRYTTDVDGILSDIASHSTRISQNETAIGLRATTDDLNSVEQTLTNRIGEIDLKADEIGISVGEIRTEFDGLSYENRNLYLYGSFESFEVGATPDGRAFQVEICEITNGFSFFGIKSLMLKTSTDGFKRINPYGVSDDNWLRLEGNNNYVISFYMYITEEITSNLRVGVNSTDGGSSTFKDIDISSLSLNEWHRISVELRPTATAKYWFYLLGVSYLSYVDGIKIEKGNRATDWSPAPEDIDNQFSSITQNLSEITVDLNGITQTVSSIESTTGELNSRLAEVETTADSITQTISQVRTDLDGLEEDVDIQFSQITQTIDSFGVLINDNNEAIGQLQLTATDFSGRFDNMEGDIGSLTLTAQGLQTSIENAEGDISRVTQLANALQSSMEDAEGNISTLTQTASSLQTEISDLESDTSSQFSQLSEAINLRVEKGDIINQINISDESILIDSSKIILDGDVTVTENFRVKNANIESVDAGKMTTGELNAAQVSIINLNADNITTGILEGIRILSQSPSGRIELNGGRLSYYNSSGRQLAEMRPLVNTAGTITYGLGIITEGDFINIGAEVGGVNRAVFRSDFINNVTTVTGPYNNLNAGSSLRLFANRRAVSDGRFTDHDQPSIILDQSDTANNIELWYGGFGARTNASTYFYHRTSDSTFSTSMRVAGNFVRVYDELRVGSTNHSISIMPYSNSVHWRYNSNNYIRQTDVGRVDIFSGGSSIFAVQSNGSVDISNNIQVNGTIFNVSARSNPTTNVANLHVFSGTGRYAHTTSARRYKVDEQVVGVDPYLIHNLNPKDWFDKFEVEENNYDFASLRRVPGLVAEDVADAGLNLYVDYDENQVVTGLKYDRLWTLLIPITRDLTDDVTWLKTENQLQANKIRTLEHRIEQLEDKVA